MYLKPSRAISTDLDLSRVCFFCHRPSAHHPLVAPEIRGSEVASNTPRLSAPFRGSKNLREPKSEVIGSKPNQKTFRPRRGSAVRPSHFVLLVCLPLSS